MYVYIMFLHSIYEDYPAYDSNDEYPIIESASTSDTSKGMVRQHNIIYIKFYAFTLYLRFKRCYPTGEENGFNRKAKPRDLKSPINFVTKYEFYTLAISYASQPTT